MRSLRLRTDWPNKWPENFRMKRVQLNQWDGDVLASADLVLFHIRGNVCPEEIWRTKRSCNYQACWGDVEWLRTNPIQEMEWLSPAAPAAKYDEILYCYEKYKRRRTSN